MSDYSYLRFEKNFNGKLDQDVFTSIRDDLNWFTHEGDIVEIRTAPKHNLYRKAMINNVRHDFPKNITTELLCLDTGSFTRMEALEILENYDIYPTTEVVVITLEGM